MNGIPTRCTGCNAQLDGHNLTGLCAECKLVRRNEHAVANTKDTNTFHGKTK